MSGSGRNPLPDAALMDLEQLPSHEVAFEQPRRADHCVLIPVIDEGERILRQLRAMRTIELGCDVLLVDGGSSDGSTEPQRLQGELGVNALLVKTGPGRLSAQLRIGLAWAMQRGYCGVVTIDGNDKDDPRAIPSFTARLAEGFDHVQGSRYLPGGQAVNTPLDRALAVRLIHAPAISLGAGFRYTDTTNGFRGYSRALLCDPRVRPFRAVFSDYNLHYYLAVRSARLGFRVCEVPVTRRYPACGPTPSKIGGLGGKLSILRQMLVAALGGYSPR